MNYSADQLTLRDHLLANEADVKARIESGEYTFATWYTTELDHWAEYDVYSVADLERYDLAAYITDESKSAYGYKVRVDFREHTLEQLENWADRVSRDAEETCAREQEEQAHAQAEFETLVADTILMGAGDRATALRWILEGEELLEEEDMGYVEYKFNLKYGSYAKEFEAVQQRAFA
jgi:hypothetical protein